MKMSMQGLLLAAVAGITVLAGMPVSASGVASQSSEQSSPPPHLKRTAASVATGGTDAQRQLDRVMRLQPGGVQVSDNAVVWGDGDVVLVVPSEGQRTAPPGLGHNVRERQLSSPALRDLAALSSSTSAQKSSEESGPAQVFDVNGCPSGIEEKDYYCFYQYRSYGGRRVQFTGDTKASDAADWGFNNGTTSWVSTDVDCTVRAYNAERPRDLGNWMWRQPENSRSSYVGSTNDNKMSFWTCNGDG